MEIKEQILKALGLSSEVKFEVQAKLVDGTIIVSTAEALVEGADVAVLTEDGTTIDLPIGEYETEDGVIFNVEEADWAKSYEELKDKVENLEDAIADIKARLGGEEVVEAAEEVTEPSTNPKSIKTTEVVEFSAEEELEKLKAENEKLKTELAATPAEAPINTNKFSTDRPALTKKEYNKLSRQERFLHNLNK